VPNPIGDGGATVSRVDEATETLVRIFASLSQWGPGSDASSTRALEALPPLPPRARILDVGCGPGRQTRLLGTHTGARVVAVDLARDALLGAAACADAPAQGADFVCADMNRLPFADASFDLVWSEGAIYVMGFRAGLERWKSLLAPGGHLAVTEVAWLREDRPADLVAFWNEEYPAIASREEHRAEIAAAGYEWIADFPLPESDWWDTYYRELGERLDEIEREDPGAGRTVVEMCRREIDVMRGAQGACSYVFYIMRKSD
jgi:serine/threonine-protein kinase HipA